MERASNMYLLSLHHALAAGFAMAERDSACSAKRVSESFKKLAEYDRSIYLPAAQSGFAHEDANTPDLVRFKTHSGEMGFTIYADDIICLAKPAGAGCLMILRDICALRAISFDIARSGGRCRSVYSEEMTSASFARAAKPAPAKAFLLRREVARSYAQFRGRL